MIEEVLFFYKDGLFQDFIHCYQRLYTEAMMKIIIPITPYDESPFDIDEFDIWYEEIYEKCPNRNIPSEYMTLDDCYKNPENPKMTKNINKLEFCSEKNVTDDYTCEFDTCPRRE